jgi:hypothetical protein
MKAAAELTSALKGTVSQDAETADALAKVSDLFQKIAASKAERAKANIRQCHQLEARTQNPHSMDTQGFHKGGAP